ncbi:unnamed protein product [Prorocentrum cordatum]|uniref:Uncharacterized protein n=1 Tax=Prorocentrum cordatum TaxID=2364126 RepID=A0ABN9RPV5_9DINO|nr:unnamed protein product [Polarella glacialis]
MVDESKGYYLACLRARSVSLLQFPQSLSVLGGRAHLDNFDATAGNLWTFKPVGSKALARRDAGRLRGTSDGAESKRYVLSCTNVDEDSKVASYLGPNLSIVQSLEKAQTWTCTVMSEDRRRRAPVVDGEALLQIRTFSAEGPTLVLCAHEHQGTVRLVEADAVAEGTTGGFLSDVWEATPDSDPNPDVLQELLEIGT